MSEVSGGISIGSSLQGGVKGIQSGRDDAIIIAWDLSFLILVNHETFSEKKTLFLFSFL